jgi:hypothetical protein
MTAAVRRLCSAVWSIVDVASGRRVNLVGAALVRVGLGATLLYIYAVHYRDRGYLWGPNGSGSGQASERSPGPRSTR